MSAFDELKTKLTELKGKVSGDLHALVTKLEAVAEHLHKSPLEDVVKETVTNDLHAAATHVERVADTVRSDVDVADKVVDAVDTAVDKAAAK